MAGMVAKSKKSTQSKPGNPASTREPATEMDVRVFEGHEKLSAAWRCRRMSINNHAKIPA